MSVRPPQLYYDKSSIQRGFDPLDYEIAAEKAASLGRSGRKVEETLERLRAHQGDPAERIALLKDAAQAVYGYFIQREVCGLRRHQEIIREYRIPNEVLSRLGAK
jgi:hypothetical protein